MAATDLGNVEVAKHGNLYLLTDPRGDVRIDGRGLGLYELDTRVLSTSTLRLNGVPLTLLRGPYLRDGLDTIQLTNPELRRNPEDKHAPASHLRNRELSVTRTRRLHGELSEQVTIVNYSPTVEALELQLGLGVDMADIFEVRGYARAARGRLLPIELGDERVDFGYVGLDGVTRITTVRRRGSDRRSDRRPGDLAGRERARHVARPARAERPGDGRLDGDDDQAAGRGGRTRRVDAGRCASAGAPSRAVRPPRRPGPAVPTAPPSSPVPPAPEDHLLDAPRIASDHEFLDRTLRRSLLDLGMLRNHGPAEGEAYLAAGIPWFATLFGRDSIIAALELVAFYPVIAVETLTVLARLQATADDPWHDAEPGKILHELRTGEMAGAGETPHDAYYGSIDSTPLWLILLGETYAWTGDDAMLDRLWPHALAALAWIDDSGDLDGDGFVEYQRRSRLGLLNQGWKDSGDAIRHVDGTPAEAPIALAEVQGYVFAARRSMAHLARHRGDTELAARLDAAADTLQARFDAAFWLDDIGYYAMALDGHKRPVASIGSNPGQALWTGIIPSSRAGRVAERLLAPDMFSGWGIRTYAAGQPGYNPVGYHTGSIWPHDNALIAAGLKSSGAPDGANLHRRPPDRGRPMVPRPAAAGAVLRLRARRGRGARRVPGRLLPAGMGRRRAVPPAAHDARAAGRCPRPSPRARAADAARVADQADHHRAAGGQRFGRPAGPSLARPDERGAARTTRLDRRDHPRLSPGYDGRPPARDEETPMTVETSTTTAATGTIVVSGTGRVAVEPDVAELRLGVAIARPTVEAARAAAAEAMAAILAAVTGAGVARRDVRTTLLSVQPRYDYRDGKAPALTGYDLANVVEVTVRDLGALGCRGRRGADGRCHQPRRPDLPGRRSARGRARRPDRGGRRGARTGRRARRRRRAVRRRGRRDRRGRSHRRPGRSRKRPG